MSNNIIEDGTGTATKLKVDSKNRAHVESVSKTAIATASLEDQQAYQMFTATMTLSSTAEHALLYFKNTSATDSFITNKFWFSWNGGDTNHDRACVIKQYINNAAPTVNHALSGAGNLNTTSGNTAALTVYVWDGVGAGMTITGGQQAGEGQIEKGMKQVDINGSTIIGPGHSVTISFTGEEVGKIGVTVEGYFEV